MMNATNIIAAAIFVLLGFFAGMAACKTLNAIPAKWLVDYDEEPSEELKSGIRFTFRKHGAIIGAALAFACGSAVLANGFSVAVLIANVVFFVLALIAAADAKYTIIPDQFTICVAVLAIIFAVTDLLTTKNFITKWYDPLIGAVAGAGILMLLDFFSMIVLKKDGFGFGDVKLLAAFGIMLGWKYIGVLLVVSFLTAAIHFLILIFSGHDLSEEGKYLPMGPYLCIACAVTVICQPWFVKLFELYRMALELETLP